MSANFTPGLETYKETGSFRFWCQKVLPLVYEDSLSYYELLCKVVNCLKDVIANIDGLKVDIDNLLNAFNELQGYVNNYFDNLDVQKEINNKLDQMVQDGTLDSIINEHILGELKLEIGELNLKTDRAPFIPYERNRVDFLNDITDCIASYFASGVGLDSVVGESNVTPKTAYVYTDGNKGYMGVLGQGEYMVWTDTVNIENVNYPVAYIDCSQFLSLITKCRNFDNSPYKYAIENKDNINETTLREKCLEMGDLDDKGYTFDFLNYIYSARMAYIMNSSGNQLRLISKKTNAGDCELTDYFNHLEDGDLVFVGNPILYPDRFLNQHHVGIYFKTLDKLNQAGQKYGVSFKDIDEGYRSEYGYLIHATGTTGSPYNTLRINTFYSYANTLPSNGTKWIYSCKPYANALNSNKALRAITGLFSEYDSVGFGYRNGNWNYIRTNENEVGRWVIQQFTCVGNRMTNGQDLNTLTDGYYRVDSVALNESIKNKPPLTGTYFDVISIGTQAGTETGFQIVISSYGEIAYRKKQVDSSNWQKWAVYSGLNPLKTGFHSFGTVSAGTKQTYNVVFDEAYTTSPIITLGLNVSNEWNVDTLCKLQCSCYNISKTGFTLCVANGSAENAYMGVYWHVK